MLWMDTRFCNIHTRIYIYMHICTKYFCIYIYTYIYIYLYACVEYRGFSESMRRIRVRAVYKKCMDNSLYSPKVPCEQPSTDLITALDQLQTRRTIRAIPPRVTRSPNAVWQSRVMVAAGIPSQPSSGCTGLCNTSDPSEILVLLILPYSHALFDIWWDVYPEGQGTLLLWNYDLKTPYIYIYMYIHVHIMAFGRCYVSGPSGLVGLLHTSGRSRVDCRPSCRHSCSNLER